MKALKVLGYGLGGLLALLLVVVAGALIVIDGAFVKARLERMMQDKGRTLSIEGEPKLRLFPVAGLALGRLVLSEPRSEKVFVALESAEIAVRTMPLLSGEAAVNVFRVAGLQVNLVRGKDGRMNFADIAGEAAREERAERAPMKHEAPAVRAAEVLIERAQITYRDEGTGQELTVRELNLKTGRLDGDKPGDFSFSTHVLGRKPDLDIRAQAAGAVRFNLSRQEIGLEAFGVQVKGRIDRDTLAVDVSAPKVEITPARASGSAITAHARVSGPRRIVDAKLRVAAVEGNARSLSIPSLALELDAGAEGRTVKGSLSTPVQANLAGPSVELPKIAAQFTVAGAGLPAKGFVLPVNAAIRADFGKQAVTGELAARFEDAPLRAKFSATRLQPLVASFDLAAERLDLDKLMPPKKEAEKKGEDRVDLSGLRGPQLAGKLAIGALTVQRLKLAEVKADIKLAGGKLEVAPHSANLYGGTLAGSLSAEANGNRLSVRETLKGVQMGPLLRDLADNDRLDGRGDIVADLGAVGRSAGELKKSLAGTVRVELRDGAVKGINLTESINDVRAALGSRSAKAADPSKRTDFSEITASFKVRNGVAHNEDLQGKAPLLRLTGAGDIDIGNSTLNYTARATVVATSKGQGGRDLSHLAGVTIPVKLSGALDKPDIAVDYRELAAKSGVDLTRALSGATKESVGDKLRGLFRR